MEMNIDMNMETPTKIKPKPKIKRKPKLSIVDSIASVTTLAPEIPLIPAINTIHCQDCVAGMQLIPDNSADIIICDPPYNIGKDFGNDSDKQSMDTYLSWCDTWIRECIRILKPDGTLYIYGFSETLAFIRTRIYCNVRWLIWHYTNKVVPSLHFWQRTHESILCCYKQKPAFNRDDVREPYTDTFLKNSAGKTRTATKGRFSNGTTETTYTAHAGGALPRDVIKVPALAGGAGKKERVNHPTQKPIALCDILIKACKRSNGGTLVVVPFAGSGSECVSAKKNNVDFIGFEINPEYITISNQRLTSFDNGTGDDACDGSDNCDDVLDAP